jgi:L-alanine-DL-glutamate epimerase-like enolase superfamily enzyme
MTSRRNGWVCRCTACSGSTRRARRNRVSRFRSRPTTRALQRALDDAAPYPVLKVKLGGLRDAHTIASVRAAAPDKILRVDANAAWDAKHALRMIDLLLDYDVEFVEQPGCGARHRRAPLRA